MLDATQYNLGGLEGRKTISGTMLGSGEITSDVFTFKLLAPGTVDARCDFEFANSGGDKALALFDADGLQIVADGSSTGVLLSTVAGQATPIVLPAGSYQIRVGRTAELPSGESPAYKLTIITDYAGEDFADARDGGGLSLPRQFTDFVGTFPDVRVDVDYYRFRVDKPSIIRATLAAESSFLGFQLWADFNGDRVMDVALTQPSPAGTLEVIVPAGAIYAMVGFGSNGATPPDSYRLSIGSADLPDIRMAGAQLGPTGVIGFRYEAHGYTGPLKVGLYKSADVAFDADAGDVLLANQTVVASAETSGQGSFILPADFIFDPDRPHLLIVADPAENGRPNGSIDESDELNNVAFASMAPPTLVVSSVTSVDPSGSTEAGISFTYEVTGLWTPDAEIGFYWASGPDSSSIIGAGPSGGSSARAYTFAISTVDLKSAGEHGPFFIPRSKLAPPPFGATYLVAAADATGKPSRSVHAFREVTMDDVNAVISPPTPPAAPTPPTRPPGRLNTKQKQQFAANQAAYQKRLQAYRRSLGKYRGEHQAYQVLSSSLVDYMNSRDAFSTNQINYPERRAAFLGQISVETWRLTTLTQGYRVPFGTVKAGYGVGRGYLQITGLGNYRAAAEFLGKSLPATRDLLATDPPTAARVSGWYWNGGTKIGGSPNRQADVWNIVGVSQLVNAGRLNPINKQGDPVEIRDLDERERVSDLALRTLKGGL